MAKLELSVDTESGEVAVSVNGESIPDVRGVEISCYGEEKRKWASFSVESWRSDGDTSNRVCITARKEEAEAKGDTVPSKYAGLFEASLNTKAREAIAQYFAR